MSQWARLRSVLDTVHVPENEAALLDQIVITEGVRVVSFVNAHGYNVSAKDNDFASALINSDILLRDGSGMKILMKLIGRDPGPNLNGTDLIPQIISRHAEAGHPIALMGTEEPWLSNTAKKLRAEGANITLTENGFQPEDHYLNALTESPARLAVLGMGMPKQEHVSMLLRDKLDGPLLVINGGAVIDFMGGKITRAPAWMRKLGIEWIYRLLKEPRRLFRRYIIGNVAFLWRALRLKLGAK
ncbi:MAG: WecB/TagA/CpsF family glycosyltransferase [Pseudomonadota bacterium]